MNRNRLKILALLCICMFGEALEAQVIDYRHKARNVRHISFRNLGFKGDINTAKMAEYFSGYTPPPGGESSAYWHNSYGGWLKGGFAYQGGCIVVAHAHQIRIWDISQGFELRRFPLHNPFQIGLLPYKGKESLVCFQQSWFRDWNLRNEIQIWDIKTGELIDRAANGAKDRVAISNPEDRRRFAAALQTKVGLVDRALLRSGLGNGLVTSLSADFKLAGLSTLVKTQISPDFKWAATSHEQGEIVLWDIASRSEVRRWQLPELRPGFRGSRAAAYLSFSSNGNRLIGSSFGDLINDTIYSVVLNCQTGGTELALPLKKAYFVPHTDLIAGESYENDIQLWSATTGKPVAVLVLFSAERYWAIKTREGYFNCSPETLEFLKANKEQLSVERDIDFIEKYYRPDVVRGVLAGIPHDLALKLPKGYERPVVSMRLAGVTKLSARVALSASAWRGATFNELSLSRKDRPLSAETLSQLTLPKTEQFPVNQTIEIPFPPGKNSMTLTASVADSYGVKGKMASLTVERSEQVEELSGRLFVLAVGVSKHKFPEYDLTYPAADAKAISDLLKRQEGLTFGEVHTQVYPDERATLKNVRDGLAWLERVATPDDVAVVFFAGHGLRGRRGLYYVTHEGDAQGIQYTCLNWEEIAKTLGKLKAKQTLFLSDVCHAGGFAKTDVPMQGELAANLQKIKNLVVFASSGPEQLSLEDDAWGHGAFTLSLLAGLNGQADTNGDGVSLQETIEFVTSETSKLTAGEQTPFVPTTGGYDEDLVLARVGVQGSSNASTPVSGQVAPVATPATAPIAPEVPELPAASPPAPSTSTETASPRPIAVQSAVPKKIAHSASERAGNSKESSSNETIVNTLGMQLRLIPAGTFVMGSTPEQIRTAVRMDPKLKQQFIDRETPQHEVMLTKDFYLGTHEVTRGNFRAFVQATGYITDSERQEGGIGWDPNAKVFEGFNKKYSWRDAGFPATEDHPVVNVSWNDAIRFCKWLSKKEGREYRLPTEAEWEYAARAGSNSIYSFGDDPQQLLRYANANDETLQAINSNGNRSYSKVRGSDGFAFTAPVGSFLSNTFGLFDIHGNVWEWCSDYCGDDYYSRSPDVNPQGDAKGPGRVFRGGGYLESLRGCRIAIRGRDRPSQRHHSIGFRVALTP